MRWPWVNSLRGIALAGLASIIFVLPRQGARSPFPAFAVRELAAFTSGVTLADWARAHPSDTLVTEPQFLRGGKEDWCARASAELRLSDSVRVFRHAYFYVPPLTQRSAVPAVARPEIIARQCLLGAVWIETSVPTRPQADTLATESVGALSTAHGGAPLPWPTWYELPLGRLLLEKVTARSRADSTVVLNAVGRPIRGAPRVVALAFAPLSRLAPRPEESVTERYQRGAASVVSAAMPAGLNGASIAPLLSLLARAESVSYTLDPTKPERAALRSLAVSTFRDWITAARGLPPSRRAGALLAADRLLAVPAVQRLFELDTEDSLPGRVPLEALGAGFEHEYYNDVYVYAHTWLNQALRLDSGGPAGASAFISLIEAGFDTTGSCGAGTDPFQQVIDRGEAYLPKMADSSLRARLHFMVGAAYAEIVGLAAGMGDYSVGDPVPFRPRAEAARAKALEHFQAGLALERSTPRAEGAWRTSWRLAAGLPPAQLSFLCLND